MSIIYVICLAVSPAFGCSRNCNRLMSGFRRRKEVNISCGSCGVFPHSARTMLKTTQGKETMHLVCTKGAPWLRYKCKWITKRLLSAIHKLGQLSLVVSVEPEPDFYHICGNMMWEKAILVNKNVGYVCDVSSLRKSKWNITGQWTGPVRQPE